MEVAGAAPDNDNLCDVSSSNSELSIDVGSSSDEEKNPASAAAPAPTETSTNGGRESYLTKLNYLFRHTRFFIIKSSNENVAMAKSGGVWATTPRIEAKLNKAFRESRNVLLIFSVKGSGRFCGFCRISSESRRDMPPVNWALKPGLPARALGGVFGVAWINRNELPFPETSHLFNPWNKGMPVKSGSDGQEVEPRVAEELCCCFIRDRAVDMHPILLDSKRASRTVKTSEPLTVPVAVRPIRRARRNFRGRGGFRGRVSHRAPAREPPRMQSYRPRHDSYPPPPPRRDTAPPRYHPYDRERPAQELWPSRYPPRELVPRMYQELMRGLPAPLFVSITIWPESLSS